MNISKKYLKTVALSVASLLLVASTKGYGALLTISDTPLFLQAKVDSNVLLVVDDSGSMDWEVMLSKEAIQSHPGATNGYSLDFTPDNQEEGRELCHGYNTLAYNPGLEYTPWDGVRTDNSPYPNASLTASFSNPYTGSSRNISDHFYMIWQDDGDGIYEAGECPALPETTVRVCNRRRCWNETRIDITACSSDANCKPVSDLSLAEQTNYSNWYSYYRKREFVAKKAALALVESTGARVGLGTMHNNSNVGTPIKDMDDLDTTTSADATDKINLMKKIAQIDSSGGTPTNATLENAGEYYRDGSGDLFGTDDMDSPIEETIGGACMRNFTILMSDGYADSSDVSVGNEDLNSSNPYDGPPYADSVSGSLADVAMYYFKTDLSSLDDKVPSENVAPGVDTMHQHMETYTVAFGVSGDISCNATTTSTCPSPPPWPTTITKGPSSIDDLYHAAFNSRAKFLSAKDPEALISSLQQSIQEIEDKTSASAAVAANTGALSDGSVVYQASFSTRKWKGNLKALPISIGTGDSRCSAIPRGEVCTNSSIWEAANTLNNQHFKNDRVILTNNSGGVRFWWDQLSNEQKSHLKGTGNNDEGKAVLKYIRGQRSHETDGTDYDFRKRDTPLGDIINSSPSFVGTPRFDYNFNDFTTFKESNASRRKMVYVGANDGMLHGFDAATGEEKLAYIPSMVIKDLKQLTDPNYLHRFYVDGPTTVGSAYFNSNWHTVLLGGLRAGGQGIYALDVTNPNTFTEANAANIVLWEFTDQDLGYTFSQPDIIRLNDGTWAAVFGNGYNNSENDGNSSSDGQAYLYVVNLQTGALIKKIKAPVAAGVDATTPNGLATVTPVDLGEDNHADTDYIYAGDLRGNLWRFNLNSENNTQWSASKIFTTRSPENNPQPITVRPSVSFHPDSSKEGFMVFFGTGRYIDVNDASTANQNTQTFYGIWDDLTNTLPTFSRGSDYLKQNIFLEHQSHGFSLRLVTDNEINWNTHHGWYLDLRLNTSDNQGERQITNPVVRNGRIIFTTLVPSIAVCSFGGDSWLMELDLNNGGPLDSSPLDINNDGVIDNNDIVSLSSGDYVIGGMKFDSIISQPTIIPPGEGDTNERKIFNTSEGAPLSISESRDKKETLRGSWSEISR